MKTTDYKGNLFNSKTAMCMTYGVPRQTYDSRIEGGMTQKEALECKNIHSVLESVVENELQDLGILFFRDRSLKTVSEQLGLTYHFTKKEASFRYDFIIVSKTAENEKAKIKCIECDGIYHFQYRPRFGYFPEFIATHNRDVCKDVTCEIRDIPLLRIKYDQDAYDISKGIEDFIKNPSSYTEYGKHSFFSHMGLETDYYGEYTKNMIRISDEIANGDFSEIKGDRIEAKDPIEFDQFCLFKEEEKNLREMQDKVMKDFEDGVIGVKRRNYELSHIKTLAMRYDIFNIQTLAENERNRYLS